MVSHIPGMETDFGRHVPATSIVRTSKRQERCLYAATLLVQQLCPNGQSVTWDIPMTLLKDKQGPPPPPSDQPRCPGLEILENCNPTCREQIRIGKCGGEGEVRSTVVKTPLVAYPSLPLCLRAYGYKTHGSTSLGPFRCCNAQTSGGPLGTPPPLPPLFLLCMYSPPVCGCAYLHIQLQSPGLG